MSEETLKGKAGLDVTDFKTGITAMNRELRVLESGFRASTASLGDWSQSATGLESRLDTLSAKMEIQQRKVAATRAEYERIKAEKGENSKAAQELEIKLNKETETLGHMENELRTTESSLEEMRSATGEAGEAVDDLGEKVEDASGRFELFKGVVDGMAEIGRGVVTVFAGIASAVAGAVGAAGTALGVLIFKTSGAAAELVDLSAKTGITTTTLQELSYVGDQVGTSLDTMTGAQARLIRSMAAAQNQQAAFDEQLSNGVMEDEIKVPVEMAAAFNGLGVAFTDSSGQLRDSQDVFLDVIDALGKIPNEAERDALSMQIFGKSAQELNPLIKAGRDEMERLAEQAHDVGAVMSEDTVAGLEAFDDTMASITAGVKGTLGTLAANFLPVFQTIGTALQELFQSDDFKQRIQDLANVLQGFVSVVVDVLSKLLSGDFKGALSQVFGADNAAGILSFFESVRAFIFDVLIPFATTHAEEIKGALIGIGAALAAAGIISVILGIVAALNPVTLIIAAVIAEVGLLSAAWAGNWGGIRDTMTLVWDGYLLPALQAIWNFLSTSIPAAISVASSFWSGTLLPALSAVGNVLSTYVFPLFQALGNFWSAVFNVALTALAGLFENMVMPAMMAVAGVIGSQLHPVFEAISAFITGTAQPAFDAFSKFISGKFLKALQGVGSAIQKLITWIQSMADALNNLSLPDWLTPGSPTPWEIGLIGINRAMEDLNQHLPNLANGLQMQPNGMPLGLAGAVDQSTNNSVQVIGNVIIRGDTPAGSLGAALRGRRY
mgnify:CR=1 FL=1